MVIFKVLGVSLSAILNLMEDKEATLKPASSKILIVKLTTVVLPLVPVMPITFMLLDGNPYKTAPKKASKKWYQLNKNPGINFLINPFIFLKKTPYWGIIA